MATGSIVKQIQYQYGGNAYDCRSDAIRAWRRDTLVGLMQASSRCPNALTGIQMEQIADWALANVSAISDVSSDIPDVEGEEHDY